MKLDELRSEPWRWFIDVLDNYPEKKNDVEFLYIAITYGSIIKQIKSCKKAIDAAELLKKLVDVDPKSKTIMINNKEGINGVYVVQLIKEVMISYVSNKWMNELFLQDDKKYKQQELKD